MPVEYRAPALNRQVTIRDPASRTQAVDRYGAPSGEAVYERLWPVWCARRDLAPRQSVEEGVLVDVLRTVFTIRRHDDIAALATVEIVGTGAMVFASVGPAIERGRRGNSASHLEIVTERRA